MKKYIECDMAQFLAALGVKADWTRTPCYVEIRTPSGAGTIGFNYGYDGPTLRLSREVDVPEPYVSVGSIGRPMDTK